MAVKAQASQTLVDLTDGFSVSLSQDSVSWNGGVSSLGSQKTVSIDVSAYQGSSAAPSFSIGTCVVSDSTNCTASVSGTTVTITVKAAATTGGTVTIPVNITANGSTVTINKTFSYGISLKGNAGTTYYTYIRYATDSSGSGMTPTPSASTKYIGIAVVTSSTAPSSASSYTWSKYAGTDGSSSYTHIRYATDSSGSGMSSTPTAATTYVGIAVTNSSTAPTTPGSYTWSKYVGDDGDPALVLSITADTTVLKNNTGTATLTAHVYYGGNEASISNAGVVTLNGSTLGTVKWYEGTSTTGTAAKTHEVSAAGITNTLTVYAKLEVS